MAMTEGDIVAEKIANGRRKRQSLMLELSEFILSMKHDKDGDLRKGKWWVCKSELPGTDFCREIHKPGGNEDFPDGVIGIRVDDDFWAVAAIPYKFNLLPVQEIVETLWPEHVREATYMPDSRLSTKGSGG